MREPDAPTLAAALQVFRGAFPEEWREPPLGWEGLLAWEAEHGVTLPEPYRSLIAEVSNGSALGPPEDGGLLPLGWLPSAWAGPEDPRDPSAPFPLERGWYWGDDAELTPQDNAALYESVHLHGSVALGSEGGDFHWLLITAGPQRGSVWVITPVGACPFDGVSGTAWTAKHTGMGFLEWVEQWVRLGADGLFGEI